MKCRIKFGVWQRIFLGFGPNKLISTLWADDLPVPAHAQEGLLKAVAAGNTQCLSKEDKDTFFNMLIAWYRKTYNCGPYSTPMLSVEGIYQVKDKDKDNKLIIKWADKTEAAYMKEAAVQVALGTLIVYVVGWRCSTGGGNDLLGVFLTKEAAKDHAKNRFEGSPDNSVRIYKMTVGATDYEYDDEYGEAV